MPTVVITGLGASTPLGGDLPSTWAAMLAGRSGISRIEAAWAEQLSTQIAGQAAVDPASTMDRVVARRLDRSSQLAMVSALEAWADAGLDCDDEQAVDPDRFAVSIASGIGGLHSLLDNWDVHKEKGPRRVSPLTIPMLMANAPAANVGIRLRARAGVHAPVSACASSNEAIAQALDLIRLGRADIALVGGAEAVLHPLPVAAFGQMQALSRRNDEPERASRPWDVDRDGFVLAEGAACLVVETLEHAQARGAAIYGTLAGAGTTSDALDLTNPSQRGQVLAMSKAVADAGLTAADIRHLNAHGTSTPAGDPVEAASVRELLGSHVDDCVVTSTKSMTGHLLGGAGALETVACVKALQDRRVPPTINLEHPEPDLGIDIAALEARDLPAGDLAAINNSFGFGGHNVSVIVTNAHATR
ncbi:MAG: beta-ketoacyl-ACP synthase II [Actinomycetia bacterium]|nr:beta-ketoacyl-ACP synthase II [Actinomycetes bacterium]